MQCSALEQCSYVYTKQQAWLSQGTNQHCTLPMMTANECSALEQRSYYIICQRKEACKQNSKTRLSLDRNQRCTLPKSIAHQCTALEQCSYIICQCKVTWKLNSKPGVAKTHTRAASCLQSRAAQQSIVALLQLM